MRRRLWLSTIVSLTAIACGKDAARVDSAVTVAEQQAVTNGVQALMRGVAQDVSKDGPAAWRNHFEDSPAFFMAVNGELAFADSQSATAGIAKVAQMFRNIQLQWGDGVRVDPLTKSFAMVAAPYHEVLTTADNQQMTSDGFFTALVENQKGQWQFRDVHWSVPAAPPAPTTPKSDNR